MQEDKVILQKAAEKLEEERQESRIQMNKWVRLQSLSLLAIRCCAIDDNVGF